MEVLLNKYTTEEFIEKARSIHGSLFDYSDTTYLGARDKLSILCQSHGKFSITPDSHLQGQGCGKCRGMRISLSKRMSKEMFLDKARLKHGSVYDYSKVEYINNHTKIKIRCEVHGEFEQRAGSHLTGRGCSKCQRHGFNKAKPGTLYILKDEDAIKIGITNRDLKLRVNELSRSRGRSYTLVFSFFFEDGEAAANVELEVLNHFRQIYKSPEELFDGSTETFINLPASLAITKIAEAIAAVSADNILINEK
jgi:hypothetical protein